MDLKVKFHTSFLGQFGYATHARGISLSLNKLCDVNVRNFSFDDKFDSYLSNDDIKIITEQSLYDEFGILRTYLPKWHELPDVSRPDCDIVLQPPNHEYFFDIYDSKLKAAYSVWESTRLNNAFFKFLQGNYNLFFCASNWQKTSMIDQGWDENFIHVIPGAPDENLNPLNNAKDLCQSDKFKFIVVGRMEKRKSTVQIIKSFLNEFGDRNDVELICLIDNPYINDNKTTEQRLFDQGVDPDNKNLKILRPVSREDYIHLIQSSHCLISCSRSEGWGLPISDSIACGTPTIYAHNSAPIDFASQIGLPVHTKRTIPAKGIIFSKNDVIGECYEPDFDQLKHQMRYVYENFKSLKGQSLKYAPIFKKEFNWQKSSEKIIKILNKNL